MLMIQKKATIPCERLKCYFGINCFFVDILTFEDIQSSIYFSFSTLFGRNVFFFFHSKDL